ncbi:MAG: hypothetical protein LKI77_05015 [Bifidobacterium sp.]|jgi:hypothetical protein|nr:hypothetical protein [Bifidobacterium sp.]
MTTREQKNYSYTQAVEIVSCSESTLRRKLLKDGVALGATKLKRGWVIPHTTLEALGVLPVVNTPVEESRLVELRQENSRLRIDNEGLRKENDGLKQLLAEREKVVALLEQSSKRQSFWQRFTHKNENAGE